VISPTGGIRPPDRCRAKQALSLSEREEISRWLRLLELVAVHDDRRSIPTLAAFFGYVRYRTIFTFAVL